ncbi:group II intron reverse transcriptase/maturase [Candidatus Hamiltonella defensa]|uniref:group II intron reverse transcriptase/maturase n=1 Tax=Candidatus Williamhamiltonella defendens TaxID=138072 RepID=UPI0015826956|nr:group II intron reverse transcriptase/maturase [Candidatus Hamiltonella defensa]
MSDCQKKAKNGTLKVRLLQRALYRKSKQEEKVRFYSLYDKVYREDVLWAAWHQVKANKGVLGIDGKAIADIVNQGEEAMIIKLQEQLRKQSYQFSPVKIVEIPKPKGGTRPLGMATVEDRIVQTAMKIVIGPIFEAHFHDCAYGYRPKRSAKQASIAIREELYQRAWGVVEVDFKAYFTSIPHDKLLILISRKIADGSMLRLIKQTIQVGIAKGENIEVAKVGVPQGSPLSPLYSNIYLNVIDQVWHKRGYPEKLGASLHRYCDDVILVCKKSAEPVLEAFASLSERISLTLNREKTRITKLSDGFDFIGFNFVKRKSPKSGKKVIYTFPAKHAQQAIRNRLKFMTSRRAPVSPKEYVELVKPVVMGWVNYFRHANASDAFRGLQRFINIRFRRYLTHRSRGRGFGWKTFPNGKLYAMGIVYIGSGMIEYPTKLAYD